MTPAQASTTYQGLLAQESWWLRPMDDAFDRRAAVLEYERIHGTVSHADRDALEVQIERAVENVSAFYRALYAAQRATAREPMREERAVDQGRRLLVDLVDEEPHGILRREVEP